MRWMRMCAPHLLLRLAQPWLQPLPCMPRMLLRWPPSALHAWHPRLHLQLPRLRRRRLRPRRLGCARDGHATCGRGCNDRSRDDFAGARSRLACACCGRRRGRAACSFAGGWCSSRQQLLCLPSPTQRAWRPQLRLAAAAPAVAGAASRGGAGSARGGQGCKGRSRDARAGHTRRPLLRVLRTALRLRLLGLRAWRAWRPP